ncbi:hypothetical protein CCNLGMII_00007 [Pseudomonas phage phi C106]|nr:hypothetical protein CCNLGMII_00007 [Pseudomonas phage phi C106]
MRRQVALVKEPPVKLVKFTAEHVQMHASGFHKVALTVTEFKLGLGPCGETVEFLGVSESIGWLTITQRTEKGTKDFKYRVQDIRGRVVIERGF